MHLIKFERKTLKRKQIREPTSESSDQLKIITACIVRQHRTFRSRLYKEQNTNSLDELIPSYPQTRNRHKKTNV